MRRTIAPDWLHHGTVVDAERSITLNIRDRDVEGAAPEKGDCCVAARCALRALDALHVYVYRTVAYVQFEEDGPIERFAISAEMFRNVIKPLDDGRRGDIVTGRYDLLAPSGSRRAGEAVKRRTALRILREAGEAPPPEPAPYRERPMIGRIRSAGVVD